MTEYALPSCYHNMLRQLLRDVIDIFNENNILYWIDGGTMLGSVRDSKFIPHDDDVDLGTTLENFNKIIKLQHKFTDIGYYFQKLDGMIKVWIPMGWIPMNDKLMPPPTLDIFLYHKKNKYYVLQNLPLRLRYLHAKYKVNDLFPLETVLFEGIKVNIANTPYPYLDMSYPNWRTEYVIDIRENIKDKRQIIIPINNNNG